MAGELEILTDAMSNLPVNVEQVIEDLGIQYFNEPMDKGQSGAIELKDGKYTIRVNYLDPRQRQRFTAAHELAHYLLHREMLVKQGRLARHADSLYDEHAQKNVAVPFNPHHEVEANKLAAEIIMPRQEIERLYDPTKDNFEEVAKQLGVSKSALVIRLKILGLLPNSMPAQPDLSN